jgi:hypothetical protein
LGSIVALPGPGLAQSCNFSPQQILTRGHERFGFYNEGMASTDDEILQKTSAKGRSRETPLLRDVMTRINLSTLRASHKATLLENLEDLEPYNPDVLRQMSCEDQNIIHLELIEILYMVYSMCIPCLYQEPVYTWYIPCIYIEYRNSIFLNSFAF